MNYIELNNSHKNKILSIINSTSQDDFNWEDESLQNVILGKIEKEKEFFNYNNEIKETTLAINKIISEYNSREIDGKIFISKINDAIKKDEFYASTISISYYKNLISMHKSMRIIGIGGMGKTHYVKYIETLLCNNNVKHLCLYGKFLIDLNVINWDEIIKISNSEEFILVIDAFNELSNENQCLLNDKLNDYLKAKKSRLYITYKTNSLSVELEKKLKQLVSNKYDFAGVSYEDTLNNLIDNYGLDVFKFEDIIYSNNALCLKMLLNTVGKLSEPERLHAISSVTYLIENYIKNSISRDAWRNTKKLTKFLYSKKSTHFTKGDILSVIDNIDDFVNEMIQYGFLVKSFDEKYTFSNETIINYLFSRCLMKDLKERTPSENINLINEWNTYFGIHEIISVAIFDLYRKDVKKAIYLTKNTFLRDVFSFKHIRNVRFEQKELAYIRSCAKLSSNITELFMDFAGYESTPFNCTNYLSELFLQDNNLVIQMCKSSANYYFVSELRHRLKSILNLIKHVKDNENRITEYFLTAIWSSALTDLEIRNTSSKIIFEIVQKNKIYAKKACEIYCTVNDDFIRESITFALSYQSHNLYDILNQFFYDIISDKNEINSYILAYASKYLKMKLGYIDCHRRDISKEFLESSFDERVFRYVDNADMHSQFWIGFRTDYNSSGIYLSSDFMKANKNKVEKWNILVDKKYHCILKGECSGYYNICDKIILQNMPPFDYKEVFTNYELYLMYQGIFLETASEYNYDFDKEENVDYVNYFNTYLSKILKIASHKFFGSIMSNYYTSTFINYETEREMVGFGVYNPFELDDNSPSIVAPISKYNETIDIFENKILKKISYSGDKDINWANNVDLSKCNILKLINEGVCYGSNLWKPICIVASIEEFSKSDKYPYLKSADKYDIYATFNENYELDDTGKNRKYTIELQNVRCNINDYSNEQAYSVCHEVDSFEFASSNKTTRLILPPPILINCLDLHFDFDNSVWKNNDEEEIIICDNNRSNKYNREIQTITMIKDDALKYACETLKLKYFVFAERFIKETGYSNECENHYQVENGNFVRQVKNTGAFQYEEICTNCDKDLKKFLDEPYGDDNGKFVNLLSEFEDNYSS